MIRGKINKTLRILLISPLVFFSLFDSYGGAGPKIQFSTPEDEIQRISQYVGKQRPGVTRSEKETLATAIFKTSKLLVFPKRSEFANEADIDRVAFLIGVIQAESQFKRTAKSKKGALGYMQIMPETAVWLAKTKSIPYKDKQDLFIADKNLKMGVLYLNDLMRKTGSPKKALLAYNAGLGGFKKWGGMPSYPKSIADHYHSWKDFHSRPVVYKDLAFLKAE